MRLAFRPFIFLLLPKTGEGKAMATRRAHASRAKKGLPVVVPAKPVEVGITTANSQDTAAQPVDSDQRRAMIAEAAYYRAERRAFEPGHELDDWCEAEGEIDTLLTRGGPRPYCGA
jgi:DUF2934 family protein